MEDEAEIVKRAQEGDQKAIDTLIEGVRGLVYQQAWKMKNGATFEDAANAGFIGALEAIKRCDPQKGRFSHIAIYYIRNAIKEEAYRACSQLSVKTTSKLAKRAFKEMRGGVEPESEHAIALKNALSGATEIDDNFLEGSELEQNNLGAEETLWSIIQTLHQRKQEIVRRSFFGDETFALIGSDLGISGERVRQLQNDALIEMKEECKRQGLSFEDLL